MALDAAQRREFKELGYTNLGQVFDATELEGIGREYDRLVNFEAQVLGNPEDGVFPYRAMMNFRSADLKRFVNHRALVDVASELLGPDLRFWWDQGINKAPGSGSLIDWHQDNGYTVGRTPPYLTFWLALDDSSTENGGLIVIPGSHKGGLRSHELRSAHFVIDEAELDVDSEVPLDARAGDLLLFSSLLIHRTVGNGTTDRQRRAWVLQYCRGDQQNADTGEVYDNRPWVMRDGEVVAEPWAERPFDLRGDRP